MTFSTVVQLTQHPRLRKVFTQCHSWRHTARMKHWGKKAKRAHRYRHRDSRYRPDEEGNYREA